MRWDPKYQLILAAVLGILLGIYARAIPTHDDPDKRLLVERVVPIRGGSTRPGVPETPGGGAGSGGGGGIIPGEVGAGKGPSGSTSDFPLGYVPPKGFSEGGKGPGGNSDFPLGYDPLKAPSKEGKDDPDVNPGSKPTDDSPSKPKPDGKNPKSDDLFKGKPCKIKRAVSDSETDSQCLNGVLVPTVRQLREMLRDRVEPNTALFYSGPYQDGQTWSARAGIWAWATRDSFPKPYETLNLKWLERKWTPDQWKFLDDVKGNQFNIRASKAFADLATGEVRVMLPPIAPGKTKMDWDEGTIWAKYEWPRLKRPDVKVIRIRPGDTKEDLGRGEVIWDRGNPV